MHNIKKVILMMVMAAALTACASMDVQKTTSARDSAAHDFTLPDQNGKLVKLSDVLKDYRGAVIAFYPKDDSRN
ncbi:MAG: redoxin domain-containing protein [Deltaproteobacteria bacterium]